MDSKQIARFAGLLVVVVIALIVALLNSYGVIKLAESIGQLGFIALGALLTLAFQLIISPEKFIAHSKSGLMQSPASTPDPRQRELKSIAIMTNCRHYQPYFLGRKFG